MALELPSSVFTKLNEAILLFNRTCTLVYPPKKEKCPNCYQNNIGGRSVNLYRSGGPMPFARGSKCSYCNGDGFRNSEVTESVELRVYYESRNFVDVGFNVDVPDNVIQTIGYMDDYDKLTKANELLVDIGTHNKARYKRISEPYNQGFKQNPTQYIVLFWQRV
tara:strand:+ start:234 stop:725 length:492 start_codon:yes stop_codon:yes gene_type:complete